MGAEQMRRATINLVGSTISMICEDCKPKYPWWSSQGFHQLLWEVTRDGKRIRLCRKHFRLDGIRRGYDYN
jgi:hypothetical protein